MFWWSWSDVKVTGDGVVEAVLELWPITAAAQTEKSETVKNFRNKRTPVLHE
jgi:hypothetical protein